jgi:outer membrane protein TolC
MKQILKCIFLLYINTLGINCVLAQTTPLENTSIDKVETNIPPLKVIIDSVLKRNGMVRYRKQHVEVQASKLKSEGIYWTRNMGIQADSRYGTFDNTSLSADGGNSATYLNTNTKQWNYGVGLYFKFPVFDLLNRKNQINLAKMELEESKRFLQFQEDEIRITTIKLYQDLILKQKILKIKSESLGNGKVNMQMVEKEFRNGLVPVAEYVRITSISFNMEAEYESAKSDYLVAKQILEDMAGFVFSITPIN